METKDLVIIGSGPAGYTAAIYAGRAHLDPLCIEGYVPGGQLMITGDVENYPGFPDSVLGPDMMVRFREQAARFGAEFIPKDVTAVDLSRRPFRVQVNGGEYHAQALIVATGATAKELGLPSERALQGHGVAYCSVCDGAFFAGKRVGVVGGGDAALQEAMSLSNIAAEVVVIHRREEFRATKIMKHYAEAKPNIDFLTPYVVEEVLGEEVGRVAGVRLRHIGDGRARVERLDGLFVSIGHTPNTELFQEWLAHDAFGYLLVEPGTTKTSIPGVFAAGDVHDQRFRQAVTAAGMGCMAAIEAERWLAREGSEIASDPIELAHEREAA